MPQISENFRLAMELLNTYPYPENIRDQLDELKKGITKEEEEFFDDLYDTLD
jgi:hypothetical protein